MTGEAIPTARALAMFRDELVGLGFNPDDVKDLVRVACDAEVRATGGLALADTQPPQPGVLAGYGRPYPDGQAPPDPGPTTPADEGN